MTYLDKAGDPRRLDADVVVGCDGFYGPSRGTVPSSVQRTYERTYAFSWLGVLADVAPSTDELIYSWHPDGFAMHSMRSSSVSRLYLQVDAGEDIADWSDDRIWEALTSRLGPRAGRLDPTPGPITEKSVLPMRSFVSTPMRHGRLFLAGDAAHIVPPTGAKGLNLADRRRRPARPGAGGAAPQGRRRARGRLLGAGLRRVWRCTHFTWWMTTMLHTQKDPFEDQLQLSQLRWVTSSRAGATGLAENYAGLPLGF